MEIVCSSEMLELTDCTTRLNNPENQNKNLYRR